jgi:hypothetical protein
MHMMEERARPDDVAGAGGPPPDLAEQLLRIRKHVRRSLIRRHAVQGACWGLVAGVPMVAAERAVGWPPGLALDLAACWAGAGAGVLRALCGTPSKDRTARHVDRVLGWNDQVATAWACRASPSPNSVELALVQATEDSLWRTPLDRIQAAGMPREARPALLLGIVMAALLAAPCLLEAFGPPPPGLPPVQPEIRRLEKRLDELVSRTPQRPGDRTARRREPDPIRKRREYQERVQERVRRLLVKARWSRNLDDATRYADEARSRLDDESLALLRFHRYEVFLIHVLSDEELSPTLSGHHRLVDAEDRSERDVTIDARVIEAYREVVSEFTGRLESTAQRMGMTYVKAPTSVPLESLVMQLFRMPAGRDREPVR